MPDLEMTEVDSRGRRCPLPVIDLAKAIGRIEVGDRVVLLADDAGARADVPAWCRMRGHELTAVVETAGHVRYTVRRQA